MYLSAYAANPVAVGGPIHSFVSHHSIVDGAESG
jgi:hypothetical protein